MADIRKDAVSDSWNWWIVGCTDGNVHIPPQDKEMVFSIWNTCDSDFAGDSDCMDNDKNVKCILHHLYNQ